MVWLYCVSDPPGSVPDPPAGPASAEGRVTIEVDARAGTTTVVISGELDLVTMPYLAEQLALVSRDSPARLVFDLAGTSFMDCGSARLIAAGQRLVGDQRPVIRRPGPAVLRILELTGLDARCEIERLVLGSIHAWPFAKARTRSGVSK
jgi:anti-anti-sigma factor